MHAVVASSRLQACFPECFKRTLVAYGTVRLVRQRLVLAVTSTTVLVLAVVVLV
jgi:hypothetical protein